jgi:hypothetical protein
MNDVTNIRKDVVDRIVYYVGKVAQKAAIHPSKRCNPYRHKRLMAYKAEMHRRIELTKKEERV